MVNIPSVSNSDRHIHIRIVQTTQVQSQCYIILNRLKILQSCSDPHMSGSEYYKIINYTSLLREVTGDCWFLVGKLFWFGGLFFRVVAWNMIGCMLWGEGERVRSPAEGGAHRISADLYGFRWRIASEVSLLSGLIPCCLHSLFFSYHFLLLLAC